MKKKEQVNWKEVYFEKLLSILYNEEEILFLHTMDY